jgi:integrase
MKTSTEIISARLRVYGKNSTKISNDCQVQLEIRNFTDNPIRISVKNSDLSLMQLKPHQMKRGVCVGRSDANLINARINKLKERLRFVMQFLQYGNIEINKTTIENFLYVKYSDVIHFITDITDGEEAKYFFEHLNQSKEDAQQEVNDENKFLLSIGVYKATGFMEALEMHNFENCRKETIIPNFTKWCKSLGFKDYPIAKFDKKAFDSFTRFMIEQPKARSKAEGEKQYYSVKTIDNMVKEVRIFLKALKENDYEIDSTAFDFKVIKGNRRNAHIKFVNSEKANVWSITADELSKIRESVNDTTLPKELRNAATLFTIQTLLGGLRISELNMIKKDSFILANDKYTCILTTKKTKKMIDSPLHSELLPILKGIDFNIDKLKFKTDIDYNTALKALAIKLDLKREIIQFDSIAKENIQDVKTEKLYNLFTSKLARKAAITLLFATGNYSIEQIATMTKHSLPAIQYYLAILTEEKAKMMGSL